MLTPLRNNSFHMIRAKSKSGTLLHWFMAEPVFVIQPFTVVECPYFIFVSKHRYGSTVLHLLESFPMGQSIIVRCSPYPQAAEFSGYGGTIGPKFMGNLSIRQALLEKFFELIGFVQGPCASKFHCITSKIT
tara:strand:+ start:385 stop:780 length:396 start_codon:yes stop_codon:yes gene_type:complete